MIERHAEMTPRETMQHEWDKEMFMRQSQHAIKMKELEIEHLKLESKIGAWFRIPVTLIRLPVYVVLAIAYIVYAARKTNPPESFYELFK